MNNTVTLKKIYDLRNEEKNRALLEKKEAVDHFEKVATQLYTKLKAKENAELELDDMYEQSAIIMKIRKQTIYIDALNQKINALQRKVQIARNNMEKKQYIVTEKHVELKKIEKMIEKREAEAKKAAETAEMKQMDEISLGRYIRAE